MSVFPFLYGDANDRGREAFEVQRLVPNYRVPARDEEGASLRVRVACPHQADSSGTSTQAQNPGCG